ncbi:hypothetical protein G9A89_021584 [Geosiphon pyriformis]|nr:hypothetical protein G9A89_021584 [Geosiphon pyriformis]
MYLVDFSTAVTYAKDFEAAELKANHAQAVNLVMNGSSDLNSKLKQFTTTISTTGVSSSNLSTTATSNLLATATNTISITDTNNLSTLTNLNTTTKLTSKQNPKTKNDTTKLEIDDGSTSTDLQFIKSTIRIIPAEFRNQKTLYPANQKPLTNNIPPAASTENKLLAAIFPFELEEITSVPLFSEATLDTKPITAMYTNTKVNGQYIKLILNSGSAGSIITKQLMDQLGCRVDRAASARIITADGATKTPIGKIDNFPFEVNDIIVPIKVLVMEATQYQALVVPATCGHFKPSSIMPTSLINFEEKKPKPTWEVYQVLWADVNHNELPPILAWDNNDKEKKKQREKHIWRTIINAWTDDNQSKMPPILDWEERDKRKGKEREENILKDTTTTEKLTSRIAIYISQIQRLWKEITIGQEHITIASLATANAMTTQKGKASRTMNHVSLVMNNYSTKECGMTFLGEGKYAMLHANTQYLSVTGYPHDEDKIWQMVNAKIKGAMPSEILKIKNNPPEPVNIVLIPNPDAFLDLEADPEEFHEHYQNLAPTKEEQKQ